MMSNYHVGLRALAAVALLIPSTLATPVSLKMTMFTWNTEYYWPKSGDYMALFKADGAATRAACDSHVINIFLQEDADGYIPDTTTCDGPEDHPFTIFRADALAALAACPHPVQWDIKCGEMHGYTGTKSGLNQQVAISIYRRGGPFEIELFSKRASLTEKGGIMVKMTDTATQAEGVAIGVHLDASAEDIRNLQICRVVKAAIKQASSFSGSVFKCKNVYNNDDTADTLHELVTEHLPLGLYFLGDSNYRLPLSTFGIDPSAEGSCERVDPGIMKTEGRLKSCVGSKDEVVQQLADVACARPAAIAALKAGDTQSLSTSLLIKMGATVNQPYPAFMPSYPFTTMQPHQLKGEDVTENHAGAMLLSAWGTPAGCTGDGLRLKLALENGIEFDKKEALRVKGHGNAEALNLGYLDRLFVVANAATTTVERDLEVQGILYGGDHLPQLFRITATYDSSSAPPARRGDAGSPGSPLRKSNTQILTTTPKTVANAAVGAEFDKHLEFGTSNAANVERITRVTNNLAAPEAVAVAPPPPLPKTQPKAGNTRFLSTSAKLRAQKKKMVV